MRKILQSIVGVSLLSVLAVNATTQEIMTVPHIEHMEHMDMPDAKTAKTSIWADILAYYTHMDDAGLMLFDYQALAASSPPLASPSSTSPVSMDALAQYIAAQSMLTPSQMPRAEAMAYWANLYNALTVQVVAQNYPVASIREIKTGFAKGPWKRDLVTVEGQLLSLDNIEHDIMRVQFKTPLVHYMVNCASVGCPNLGAKPWQAATLEADLEAAARAYVNSPRGVSVKDGRVQASKIYKWFRKDFGSKADVFAHLKHYADPELQRALNANGKIDKYAYDWALNQF